MKHVVKQTIKDSVTLDKQRSYQEIIEFLDAHWQINLGDTQLTTIKKLDAAFDAVSEKTNIILVNGTNGKTLTIHFTAKLLREEGLKVTSFCSPHILTYNELISCNNELISNKLFTELGNMVLNTAEELNLTPNSHDILVMMALLYNKEQQADVVIFEVDHTNQHNATLFFDPKVVGITRVTPDDVLEYDAEKIKTYLIDAITVVKPGTHVVSADQSKLNLQTMSELVEKQHGIWAMPIRKLATLAYPFEQLHGRCAALAERIAYLYVNNFATKDAIVVSGTLLTKKKGQRGRPTLEAKRQSELHPRKTVDQFWKEIEPTIPGRFQLLDKDKPSILIDNADNLDAFKNLLLGIRLLHYQRPLKGLALIIGSDNPDLNVPEFLKLLRYFFKKTSGHVLLCPAKPTPERAHAKSWNIDAIAQEIKNMKIKVKSFDSFTEAFNAAQKTVDERHGLVVITGSTSLVSEYWHYRGMKRL